MPASHLHTIDGESNTCRPSIQELEKNSCLELARGLRVRTVSEHGVNTCSQFEN